MLLFRVSPAADVQTSGPLRISVSFSKCAIQRATILDLPSLLSCRIVQSLLALSNFIQVNDPWLRSISNRSFLAGLACCEQEARIRATDTIKRRFIGETLRFMGVKQKCRWKSNQSAGSCPIQMIWARTILCAPHVHRIKRHFGLPVPLILPHERSPCMLENISSAGACVRVEHPIAKGDNCIALIGSKPAAMRSLPSPRRSRHKRKPPPKRG